MRALSLITLLILVVPVIAQDDPWSVVIAEKVPVGVSMSASLYQLARFGELSDTNTALKKAKEFGYPIREDGRLYVEAIWNNKEARPTDREIRAFDMEPTLVWRNIVASYVPLDKLIPIARKIHGTAHLQFVTTHGSDFEGQAAQNAKEYVNAGFDGSGITIGLIDKNYDQLNVAIDSLQAPASMDSIALPAGTILEVNGSNRHGTGCLEAIFDNAPGANFVVGRFQGDAAFGALVDSMVAVGVDIISTSSAGYNQDWNDDTGPWSQAVEAACNAGVLFFNSAGNSAQQHWEGAFDDFGNGIHVWDGGTDTTNQITLAPNEFVRVWLRWDDPSPGDEYDLFLYGPGGSLVGSSTASSGFESVGYSNPSTSNTLDYTIVVQGQGASPPTFEVFAATSTLEHQVEAGSTRSPSDCTHPNALSVGAVSFANYDSLPGTDPLEGYSSRGPTNSGNQAPDICGPTNTFSVVYAGPFSGTSCATPNAAGAAAVLWSSLPDYSADGIRMLLLKKAELFKDWGAFGTDMLYGHGGLFLYGYLPLTEYVLTGSGNTTGSSDLPYATFLQADQFAPANSNVFFFGGVEGVPDGYVLDIPRTYRSIVVDTSLE